MPSMPVFFWGDADGSRYRESYFEMFPGVWRHGDWIEITARGTAIIYGRSDSTINRGGIRMGTAEIYRAVLSIEESSTPSSSTSPAPAPMAGCRSSSSSARAPSSTTSCASRSPAACASSARPATCPTRFSRSPRSRARSSGKVLEVPVKRILMGTPAEKAASRDSLANPAALDYFTEMAKRLEA